MQFLIIDFRYGSWLIKIVQSAKKIGMMYESGIRYKRYTFIKRICPVETRKNKIINFKNLISTQTLT